MYSQRIARSSQPAFLICSPRVSPAVPLIIPRHPYPSADGMTQLISTVYYYFSD